MRSEGCNRRLHMVTEVPEAIARWSDSGRILKISGRRIFTVDVGPRTADAVLLLHGFPGSSFDWSRVVDELGSRYRILTLDLLGFGLSEKPLDMSYSLLRQADICEEFLAGSGIEKFWIASHDMGDSVAAELLARNLDGEGCQGLTGLLLTNGSIFIEMAQLTDGQQALLALPDAVLAAPLPVDLITASLLATFPNPEALPAGTVHSMAWLAACNKGDRLFPRLIRYIEERRRLQSRWLDALVRAPVPVAIGWGALDPIAVLAMASQLKELRPTSQLTVWDDVGHWPNLEVPERVAALIEGLVG